MHPHVADNVSSSNAVCPFNLGRVCPDGTDLTQYSNLAICISDGSVDEGSGMAASSICMFPADTNEWEDPAVAIKMYARGSATAELVGMALSLHTLMKNVLMFETAVVYTDNAHCVRYIGDSTRYGMEPGDDDGWKLYQLILHIRHQVLQLQNSNKYILVKKLPREQNVADSIAKACMRNERDSGWPLRERIPRIDDVPNLLECIFSVSEKSKMVASGESISRYATYVQ